MKRAYILPILAVVGIILGVRTVVSGSRTIPPAQPVAEPARAPFSFFVAGSGIVEANTENIAIATPLAGVLQSIFVKVGQDVKAGEPLFALDDRAAVSAVAAQKSVLAVSEAQLAEAREQFEMWQGPYSQRAVSREEYSKRRHAELVAEARVAQAKAELASLTTDLDRLTVKAPVDGTILQIKVRVGEFAPAAVVETPLMVLGNIRPLFVRVDVDENDAWRVRHGVPAKAFVRGNPRLSSDLQFVRLEPLVIPKRSLTGGSAERVDTRVLQVIFRFTDEAPSIYIGQLMDVFIEASE